MALQKALTTIENSPYFICNESAKTILIVDDNEQMLTLLDLILTDAGYEVLQASCYSQAMEKLATKDVFALLTDLQLPSVSGWQLAESARNYNPYIKVVVLTGYDFLATPPKLGLVDLVIGKPVDVDVLLEKLNLFNCVLTE